MAFQKVCEIIAEVLGVDAHEIDEDTTFMDDLGADSLDAYQIVLKIEEAFQVKFTAEEVEKITTVADALALIERS